MRPTRTGRKGVWTVMATDAEAVLFSAKCFAAAVIAY